MSDKCGRRGCEGSSITCHNPGVRKRPEPVSIGESGSASGGTRRKAVHEIIEVLRDQIASGELPKGARLPNEGALAAHFGVSHPTVREALRVLEAMGLVDVRHGSGAYVTGDPSQLIVGSLHTLLQMDRVGILDVVDMRMALASYSIRRAVAHVTDEELDVLDEQEARLDEAGHSSDLRRIADAAVAFQVSLSAAAHSALLFAIESVLATLLVRLQVDAFSQRDIAFWREWSLQFDRQRRAVLHHLRARDETAAAEAMHGYLQMQRERFASDAVLAEARVSDPDVLRVLSSIKQ